MKAIFSITNDDNYDFFYPIVVWTWNKLGLGTICFMPGRDSVHLTRSKVDLIDSVTSNFIATGYPFNCPSYKESSRQKEATYAQCSRLFAGCLNIPDDEILITTDADMLVFSK